ncbi:hypothetical protein KAR91_63655, partial [Candidatus Pacearchaeota archaeon]|nr:hypothetical protein [Candidatus Pacearchaeota archaeon]
MAEEAKLQKFIEDFFKKIKAEVVLEKDLLTISNVNPAFEKVYGKKSPYKLVFTPESLVSHSDAELLKKGHLILRVAAEFLEDTAKTGLLKIDFGINCEDEIKKQLILQNCEINKIKKVEENSYIYRFTFKTIIQYQNEREDVVTEIYLKDGHILEKFNINAFNSIDGNKREIEIEGVKESYPLAKELIKERLKGKLEEISNKLEDSIDREIARIKNHYAKLIGEIIREYERTEKQFVTAKKSLEAASSEEKIIILEKLNRINQTIERIKREGKKEQLEKEEAFFINDEKHKHSINLKNSLINTTIIYYPKYILTVFLKSGDLTFRQIKLTLDPMSNSLSKINCDSCNAELNEIILCGSGHLTCRNCGDTCTCNRIACKSCRKVKCKVCDREVCTKCSKKCYKCSKEVCEAHIHKDFMTGKYAC